MTRQITLWNIMEYPVVLYRVPIESHQNIILNISYNIIGNMRKPVSFLDNIG